MLFNNKRDRPPINPNKPVMAQKILQQSREAELSLADALVNNVTLHTINISSIYVLTLFFIVDG